MLLPSSCDKKKANIFDQYRDTIERYQYDFASTQNKKYLDSSYQIISKAYTNNVVIDQNTLELIFPTYFNLERYEELSDMLKNKNELDSFTRDYSINLLEIYSSLKKGNRINVENAANKNIGLIEDKLKREPFDSVLILELYRMKSHIMSMSMMINEVDSLSKTDGLPTSFFYEEILVPEIKRYNKSIPFLTKD